MFLKGTYFCRNFFEKLFIFLRHIVKKCHYGF
nr:MAG TPA: hypothetical protein [Caudoviricetes sp.]